MQLIDEYVWSDEIFKNIMIYDEIKDYIYRKKKLLVPKTSYKFFTLEESFKKTIKGDNFCIFDEIYDNERIIMFLEIEFVKKIFIGEDLKIYCDGTFLRHHEFSINYIHSMFLKGRNAFPYVIVF